MVRVKICGITNLEDAQLSVELGAHALGFVFASSPRRVEPKIAKRISSSLPPFVSKVGIFVNKKEERVREIVDYCGLDVLQFHGDEDPAYCKKFKLKVIKAVKIKPEQTLFPSEAFREFSVDAFLLDTYIPGKPGGTGKSFRWELAKEAKKYGPLILSGGLGPENVYEAIQIVRPYAVDVSSGVEKGPGKKDPKKLTAFFQQIERAS